MERKIGTVSRGIRCPIIREGDRVVDIVVESVLEAATSGPFEIQDKDIIGVTESVVARAQGNYVDIDDIAQDVKSKFGDHTVGVIFPILSRNRFSVCLKAIARGSKKIVLMLSYPSDEVGNALVTLDQIDQAKINPYSDVLNLKQYRDYFGDTIHEFTGIDYPSYYKQIIEDEGCIAEIIFANHALEILKHTSHVLTCDIHSRERTKRTLKEAGACSVYGLDDLVNTSINGSGFNEQYGLLGSNKSTETSVKLFPRDAQKIVLEIQKEILKRTNKLVEVLVYGDGAFKDPQGKIWELADPCVSPGFSDGLKGTPNEIKLKYLADNDFKELEGDTLKDAISKRIKDKDSDLFGSMASQGTTPRQIVDLVGSLCDLTSGSGDKGTPIVYIQGYFDNFTN